MWEENFGPRNPFVTSVKGEKTKCSSLILIEITFDFFAPFKRLWVDKIFASTRFPNKWIDGESYNRGRRLCRLVNLTD
jgi:hypothetical protein